MAKGERELMKRKLDQAVNHVEKCCEILQEVAEIYANGYPEILEQYKTTWAYMKQGEAIMQMLRRTY